MPVKLSNVRTSYKVRVYPTPEQATVLNCTLGCARLVWNKVLAWRKTRYRTGRLKTSYAETDRYLTELKRDPNLAFLSEVSCVPLQQTLRHQHTAFVNFFAGRARYPRYKSRQRKDFAVTSDGEKIANARRLAKRERNLARYQRRMARKQRGSSNRAKARAKVARAHRKVAASRADFLHKASARLVRDHDVVVIEDLNVKGMVRNRRLAKAISDCGWGEFRRQLEYKAARYGRHLIVIDRWYPSSKTCSACGHLLVELGLSTGRGVARRVAPCTTGMSTRPRTFWRQVLPCRPVEVTSDTRGPLGRSRHRNRNPSPRGPESPLASLRAESSQGSTVDAWGIPQRSGPRNA
ncbi:hypothetical protein GCM10023191_075240 [Actinoallomurus oryzae]|uniref:Transposase n=1 Tax=Actinoallomurus oryzae TaxID=502180 RepID=A0ABP8QVR7_9ACTN